MQNEPTYKKNVINGAGGRTGDGLGMIYYIKAKYSGHGR